MTIYDDKQVGTILNRREFLKLLGAVGATVLVGCGPGQSVDEAPTSAATQAVSGGATPTLLATAAATLPSCIVRPEMTEGPYFVDERLNRSDIRSDLSDGSVKEGVPLLLAFNVSQVTNDGCVPLAGAQVDVWHCDAFGVYSDVTDPGFSTVGQKFLRGYQVTDASGKAQFVTIYPGWYDGRTVHIHFKIRTDPDSARGYEFTSQLFFDDALTDQVYQQAPYSSRGQRTLRNEGDNIFQNGGEQLILQLTKDGEGYAATFDVGLQMS
ncbi:MAG: twin-arginine translocation signal domain-containing protein [Chloroflexota bacterium]